MICNVCGIIAHFDYNHLLQWHNDQLPGVFNPMQLLDIDFLYDQFKNHIIINH